MKPKLVTIAAIAIFNWTAHAQGCSDAGFCTIDSFKPIAPDSVSTTRNQVKAGVFFGQGDHSVSVYGNYLEYGRQLTGKFGIDARLTTLAQTGNGISTFGLSDVFVNLNYKTGTRFRFTVGAKVPLTKADRTKDGLPLPMDYQSGLGTFDVILGAGFTIRKFQFVAALQQPLTQNDNRFLASAYPATSKLGAFTSTNKFQRRGDALLRVSYPLQLSPKVRLTPGLLPIFHLADDAYIDASGVEHGIAGSRGLTLNGNLFLNYAIDAKNAVELNFGTPFIVRDVRPDGLTRSLVVNLEYKVKF